MTISTRRSQNGRGNTVRLCSNETVLLALCSTDSIRAAGDVVYARFLTKDVLIINSAAAARVLMEKRGAKYSGRPPCTYIRLCESEEDWCQTRVKPAV